MAVDMFLKLDGVIGNPNIKGEIQVLSFSWGLSNPASNVGGGGGAGKPNVSDFSIVKQFDEASGQLMEMCCTGHHAGSATFRVVNAAGKKQQQDYLIIKMSDVLISSYQTGGADGSIPMESVTFSFQSIDMQVPGGKGGASCHFGGKN